MLELPFETLKNSKKLHNPQKFSQDFYLSIAQVGLSYILEKLGVCNHKMDKICSGMRF